MATMCVFHLSDHPDGYLLHRGCLSSFTAPVLLLCCQNEPALRLLPLGTHQFFNAIITESKTAALLVPLILSYF